MMSLWMLILQIRAWVKVVCSKWWSKTPWYLRRRKMVIEGVCAWPGMTTYQGKTYVVYHHNLLPGDSFYFYLINSTMHASASTWHLMPGPAHGTFHFQHGLTNYNSIPYLDGMGGDYLGRYVACAADRAPPVSDLGWQPIREKTYYNLHVTILPGDSVCFTSTWHLLTWAYKLQFHKICRDILLHRYRSHVSNWITLKCIDFL